MRVSAATRSTETAFCRKRAGLSEVTSAGLKSNVPWGVVTLTSDCGVALKTATMPFGNTGALGPFPAAAWLLAFHPAGGSRRSPARKRQPSRWVIAPLEMEIEQIGRA